MTTTTQHTVHQLVVLVLDVSPSMASAADASWQPPIDDLNTALERFAHDLRAITHCAVELMTITFAEDVQVEHDFETVADLHVPLCVTRGEATDLGGALARALDEVQGRRDYLRQTGIEVMQPWLVCITDAQPNRNTSPGIDARLVDLVNRRKCVFLPVAVGGYSAYPVLEALSPLQNPIVVPSRGAGGLTFSEFFRFLSQSMASGEIPNLADLKPGNEELPAVDA